MNPVLLIIGILSLGLGFLFFQTSLMNSILRASNAISGIKTNITKETIIYRKTVGTVLIIAGIFFVILGFRS